MATGYTRWAGRGQWGTSPQPLSQLWSVQNTDTHRHTDTVTHPSQDMGTDPLHPSQEREAWSSLRMLLKHPGTQSEISLGLWSARTVSTSHRRPSLSPRPALAPHTTSTLKDEDGWKPGKVPSQAPGRSKLSGEACPLQVLGQHPALLVGLL